MINADITIYNKIFNKETRLDDYISYQIKGVSWNDKKMVKINQGIENANQLNVFIFSDKIYKLNEGDIIVKGLIYDNIKTQKELENKYDNVYNITSCAYVNRGSKKMHHYEIGAK